MSDNNENQTLWETIKKSRMVHRALVTLAFIGCVNAAPARSPAGVPQNDSGISYRKSQSTVTLDCAITELDGEVAYLRSGNKRFKVQSPDLVRAATAAHNKRGGELSVRLTYDTSNSQVVKGRVYHSPVRFSNGIGNTIDDIRSGYDDINEMGGYLKDVNISRLAEKGSEIVNNLATVSFKGGIVKTIAPHPERPGQQVWIETYKVGPDGTVLPQYRKGNNRQGPVGNKTISFSQGKGQLANNSVSLGSNLRSIYR